MKNAFKQSFKNGYNNVVLIGSDIPAITTQIIIKSFNELKNKNIMFGPAKDGGYYLIGMQNMHESIFTNKAWSTTKLLQNTLQELSAQNKTYGLLPVLNDIDNYSDLIQSNFYKNNKQIQDLILINESQTIKRNT